MVSDFIPMELTLEILLRLPSKSLARFRSVSKQWASIIDSPRFKDLFLTKSSSHPRLIFAIEEDGLWSFFSLPQHLSPYEKPSSSLVLTPQFHMKFPPDDMWWVFNRDDRKFACGYASGLIYFSCMSMKEGYDGVPVICNPKTGRYEILPYIRRYRKSYGFFGFDPINKQYKILFIAYPCGPNDHRIMTLGTRGMRWRKIKCSLRHEGVSEGVCINGVLYYLGDTSEFVDENNEPSYVIVCFDVRSEKFKFIYPESFCELINYNGKLGVIYYDDLSDDAVELRVWVLEDVEKQEWSKYSYTLRGDKLFPHYASVVGVISTGEIVLSMADYTSKQPFYIYYFNPERNTIRRVEIQGFGEYHEASQNNPSRVYVFVDDCSRFYPFAGHVEDLNVKDPELLKSSIYSPYVKNEESEESEEEFDDYGFPCFYGKKKKNKPDESRRRKRRKNRRGRETRRRM